MGGQNRQPRGGSGGWKPGVAGTRLSLSPRGADSRQKPTDLTKMSGWGLTESGEHVPGAGARAADPHVSGARAADPHVSGAGPHGPPGGTPRFRLVCPSGGPCKSPWHDFQSPWSRGVADMRLSYAQSRAIPGNWTYLQEDKASRPLRQLYGQSQLPGGPHPMRAVTCGPRPLWP